MQCVIPTMRSLKIKFFAITVIALAVYLFLFYILIGAWFLKKEAVTQLMTTSVKLPYVIVHIDLKGSPPKLTYLQSLLPMLKDHGVNGLLMEYEDMFPYEGNLVNLSAKTCYGRLELKAFLTTAIQSGFEIIPLIQTFGHLEYALKLQEFKHLREAPVYPDSICPSKAESRLMVTNMLKQMISFHNDISPLKHIHVGCDEVYHMNKCDQCTSRKTSANVIYIDYIKHLSVVIKNMSPDITILIWDDRFRKMKPNELIKIDGLNNIEPVYWEYNPLPNVSYISLLHYHKKFSNIWAASAFKGADGISATIPNLMNRVLNNFRWMNLLLDFKISGEDKNFHFKGIILTGWSRFSHFDPACELLPVSIPSLIINLRLIQRFKSRIFVGDLANTNIYEFFSKYLVGNNRNFNCRKTPIIDTKDNIGISSCSFEGSELYNIMVQYILLINNVASGFHTDTMALSSVEYYSLSKYINMNMLIPYINWCNDTLNELLNVEGEMFKTMKRYYNNDFIIEYVNYKTYNAKKKLRRALKLLHASTYNRVWKRRSVLITNFTGVSIK